MTSPSKNMLRTGGQLLWLLVVLGMGITCLYQFSGGLNLETSILKLLPASRQDRVYETIRNSFQGNVGKTVLIMLETSSSGDPNQPSLTNTQKRVARVLKQASVFGAVRLMGNSSEKEFFDLYFPHRYHILAPSIRDMLNDDQPLKRIRDHVVRHLHSTSLPMYSELLDRDPLFLFPELMASLGESSKSVRQKARTKAHGVRKFIVARLNAPPMKRKTQKKVRSVINQIRDHVRSDRDGIQFRWTGVVRFAMGTRREMKSDVSFIGTISLIGVILLVFFAFRSLKQLALLIGTVGIGFLGAFTVCLFVFNLHVITVAFGATLIGISVDYAFHYFTEYQLRDASWTSWSGLRHILPGISMGVLTSVVAFAGISLTPFPALRQIALFTSAGLICAFLTVVAWYPLFFGMFHTGEEDRKQRTSNLFLPVVDWFLNCWKRLFDGSTSGLVRLGLAGLFGAVILAGLSRISVRDRVEQFNQVPEELVENDRYIRRAVGIRDSGRYVLIEGETPQQLLQHQETVDDQLEILRASGEVLEGYISLGSFLPSVQQQKKDRNRLRRFVMQRREKVQTTLRDVGFKKQIIDRMVNGLRRSHEEVSYLTPREWKNHPASFGLRDLWLGPSNGSVSSLVILQGIKNEDRIQERIKSLSYAHYRNRARTFTELLREYRWRAMKLTGAAYGLIALLLIVRYGAGAGLLVLFPAVGGSLLTVALLGLFYIPLNLMHILGLLIILGMGIDYAVFIAEAAWEGERIRACMLAILLSALTTVLSFGCLSFSEAHVIQSIGIIVFPGILIILFLSPLVYYGKKRMEK